MKYTEIPANTSGIYKINFPNGKIYIGRAINIKNRIREHYIKVDNTPCQKALWKYYKDCNNIEIEILEIQEKYDYKEICLLEKKWIREYESNNKEKGYNVGEGGEGGSAGTQNPASKISEEDLNNIISLLKEGKGNIYIANIYNLHPDTIGKINQGKTYYNEELVYPIRTNLEPKNYEENYNSFSEEQLDNVFYLLINTTLSNADIGKQIGMSSSTVSKINMGTHVCCKKTSFDFPHPKNQTLCFSY